MIFWEFTTPVCLLETRYHIFFLYVRFVYIRSSLPYVFVDYFRFYYLFLITLVLVGMKVGQYMFLFWINAIITNLLFVSTNKHIYWTKVITQLVNSSISVWIFCVGQSFWDILLNYLRRIFGGQWVTSLQHGCLSSNLIGQNGFLSPWRLPRV